MIQLSEYCESVRDGTHDSPKAVDEGYLLVTSKNIRDGGIDFSNCYNISCNDYEKINKRSKVDKNDILMTMIGTVGRLCVVKDENPNFAIKNIALLKISDEYKSKWMYYYLSTKSVQNYFEAVAGGTSQHFVGLGYLRKFRVLDFHEESRQICDILSAYDDLIENNNKRIKILEQISENLYKEWFVRFRFPGYENAEFENGIPKGWGVVRLGNLANVCTGKCNREDAEEDGIYPLFDRSQETKKSNTWLLDCEAIIIPGEGTGFISRYYKGKFNLHQRCYCVEPKYNDMGHFLFQTLKMNRRYFLSVATGATVPSLRLNNFLSFKFILPRPELCKEYNDIALSIYNETMNIHEQNKILTKQRDLLLPRLMSGKLEV